MIYKIVQGNSFYLHIFVDRLVVGKNGSTVLAVDMTKAGGISVTLSDNCCCCRTHCEVVSVGGNEVVCIIPSTLDIGNYDLCMRWYDGDMECSSVERNILQIVCNNARTHIPAGVVDGETSGLYNLHYYLSTSKELGDGGSGGIDMSQYLTKTEADSIYARKTDVAEAIEYVESAKNTNKELVSPEVSGTWTVFKNDGQTRVSTSDAKTLDVENGHVVSWSGTYKWTATEGKKNPTAVSGDWTTLTASGENSTSLRKLPLTSDTTISATLSAPKTGLMVSGSSVELASGNDTKTDSVKVSFKHRRYWGLVSSSSVTADAVKKLSGTDLNNSRTAKLTGISATDSQYYVIAYPKAMGELTKIVQNGATPLLSGGFVKSEVTVVNDAGASVAYLVYRTEKPGALKDNSYLEIA